MGAFIILVTVETLIRCTEVVISSISFYENLNEVIL